MDTILCSRVFSGTCRWGCCCVPRAPPQHLLLKVTPTPTWHWAFCSDNCFQRISNIFLLKYFYVWGFVCTHKVVRGCLGTSVLFEPLWEPSGLEGMLYPLGIVQPMFLSVMATVKFPGQMLALSEPKVNLGSLPKLFSS